MTFQRRTALRIIDRIRAMRPQARVVVGARSSLFLPFPELGLVIVDEEHEQAFKQQDGAIYHARDMAVVRARIEDCPVILASATPSLESFVNGTSGRYSHLRLPARNVPPFHQTGREIAWIATRRALPHCALQLLS